MEWMIWSLYSLTLNSLWFNKTKVITWSHAVSTWRCLHLCLLRPFSSQAADYVGYTLLSQIFLPCGIVPFFRPLAIFHVKLIYTDVPVSCVRTSSCGEDAYFCQHAVINKYDWLRSAHLSEILSQLISLAFWADLRMICGLLW